MGPSSTRKQRLWEKILTPPTKEFYPVIKATYNVVYILVY